MTAMRINKWWVFAALMAVPVTMYVGLYIRVYLYGP